MQGQYRYAAFLSYSRSDVRAARRLQRAIETYRLPRGLGSDPSGSDKRSALRPIFRDQDDFSASGDLQGSITEALSSARALIVLCSPEAAASEWVSQEIAYFKRERPDGQILPLILSGEPNHQPAMGETSRECFPAALRYELTADGEISDTPVEPLAADMRPNGDGRRLARLKIIASLLGVELDQLVERDAHRKIRILTSVMTVFVGTIMLLAWLTYTAMDASERAMLARADAEDRQAAAEDLVEFMLGDLRQRLEPVGRLDVLDAVGEKALSYYESQNQSELDADSLGRRSRALHLLGEIYDLRGDIDAALEAFQNAERATGNLLTRDPDNPDRVFDHAQSIFWVGYVAMQYGDLERAEEHMQSYLEFSERLAAMEPEKEEWQLELQYAHGNLGSIAFQSGEWDAAAAAFSKALLVGERMLEADPLDDDHRRRVAETSSWLASTHLNALDYSLARHYNNMELDAYNQILLSDPANMMVHDRYLTARRTRAEIQQAFGEIDPVLQTLKEAEKAASALLRLEPGNTATLEHAAEIQRAQAELHFHQRQYELATVHIDLCIEHGRALTALDQEVVHWRTEILYPCLVSQAHLEFVDGQLDRPLETLTQILGDVSDPSLEGTGRASSRLLTAAIELLRGDLFGALGRAGEATQSWQVAHSVVAGADGMLGPRATLIEATALQRLGRIAEASQALEELGRTGYRHPAFIELQKVVGSAVSTQTKSSNG